MKTEGGLGLYTHTHTHIYPLLGGFINMFVLHTFNFEVWVFPAEAVHVKRWSPAILVAAQALNGWSLQRSAPTKQNKVLISLEMQSLALCTFLIHVTADWC